ncbi:MAG: DUF1847 domain-containing protein [Veillonellales bacterium]
MISHGKCAQCKLKNRICQRMDGNSPAFCSTCLYADVIQEAEDEYNIAEINKFACEAAEQEATCYIDRKASPGYLYPVKPRVQEIIEFARRMEYRKLGVAFCMGLHKEAAVFCKILEDHGFDVVSVVCKVGGKDKTFLGLKENQKIHEGCFEPMCNPIAQAKILNTAQTEFNILLGLCVGHDSLFIKYSQSLVTILAVKDRVLGHNPLAAIYNYDSYYERFQTDRIKELDVKSTPGRSK